MGQPGYFLTPPSWQGQAPFIGHYKEIGLLPPNATALTPPSSTDTVLKIYRFNALTCGRANIGGTLALVGISNTNAVLHVWASTDVLVTLLCAPSCTLIHFPRELLSEHRVGS